MTEPAQHPTPYVATVPAKPDVQPFRTSGLLLIGCLVLLAALFSLLYGLCLNRANRMDRSAALQRIDPQLATQITSRGAVLLDQPGETWSELLASGRTSPADYLLRLFISPQYLAGGASDAQFVRDVQTVLTGQALEGVEAERAEAVLLDAGSRLVYINDVLLRSGLPGRLETEAEPTRLRTLTQAGDGLPDGREVIGRLPVSLNARFTGTSAVLRLYAAGRLVDELPAQQATAMGEQTYRLTWDTDLTGSGMHQLSLLALSSDGRGTWLELASLFVPEIEPLPAGSVLARERGGWYRIEPWQDGTIRLNILDASTSLTAELYTMDNQLVTTTASQPGQPGALPARLGDEQTIADPFYVRISYEADTESAAAVSYTLVSAPTAARHDDKPDQWLAVLAQTDATVQVQDIDGARYAYPSEQLRIFDPQAQLSDLSLRLPDGSFVRLTPAFTSETQLYVVSVPPDVARVNLAYTAMEGRAADIHVSLENPDRMRQSVDTTAEIPLDPALNQLTLSVSGFDGLVRTYQLYVLRPPDKAGLSQMLDVFPIDYRLPLLLLHVQYPAYLFEAQITGIDWLTFLDAQSERDRSLIDANHVPASWVKPDSPVYDGNSWKAAARQVVAYYGDPRNFLDPVNLFQFEKLTYLPALHTREGVEQILQGTFMEHGRSSIDYAGLILAAGQDADISPFFLAARIIQEMGNQGQSPLASGTLSGYEGVYNFYNIGSTPNPDVPDGARINGARYALYGRNPDRGELTEEEVAWLLPWTTPERAITGGARWIAERYVAIGQDTLYGQKFDLVAEDGLFIRQYAQNIQMAWAEGRRTRRAWQDLGMIQEAFVFRIPVFENRPDQPATLP